MDATGRLWHKLYASINLTNVLGLYGSPYHPTSAQDQNITYFFVPFPDRQKCSCQAPQSRLIPGGTQDQEAGKLLQSTLPSTIHEDSDRVASLSVHLRESESNFSKREEKLL